MQIRAKNKGGKCLSTEYMGANTKLKWQCAKGHTWMAAPQHIRKKNGTWCPTCSISGPKGKRFTIEDMHVCAKSKGGKCLSTEYMGTTVKLKWQCVKGHTWMAAPQHIRKKNGTWCPMCSDKGNYSEEICRYTFEKLFNKNFLKCRPNWLKGKNGIMELDGYNKALNLAFEYQGYQHYEPAKFSKNQTEKEMINNLKTQQDRDKLKVRLCQEKNVNLIVISYKTNLSKLPQIIKKKCQDLHIDVNNINFNQTIDIKSIPIHFGHSRHIKKLQNFAKSKGGKLITKGFMVQGTKVKLKWQCAKGHTWMARPSNVYIKNGTWCPTCDKKRFKEWAKLSASNRKHNIEDMQIRAKNKGGKCLSTEYMGANTKLKWQCAKGHTWMAMPSTILNHWCPTCSISGQKRKNSGNGDFNEYNKSKI